MMEIWISESTTNRPDEKWLRNIYLARTDRWGQRMAEQTPRTLEEELRIRNTQGVLTPLGKRELYRVVQLILPELFGYLRQTNAFV